MQIKTKGGQVVMLNAVGYEGFCGIRIIYRLKRRGLRQREYLLDQRAGVEATSEQVDQLREWFRATIPTLSLLALVHLTEDKVAKSTGIGVYIPPLKMSRYVRNIAETC